MREGGQRITHPGSEVLGSAGLIPTKALSVVLLPSDVSRHRGIGRGVAAGAAAAVGICLTPLCKAL